MNTAAQADKQLLALGIITLLLVVSSINRLVWMLLLKSLNYMQNDFVLKVNCLSHSFTDENKKDFEVLKNISFNVKKGEFLSIVGPSGGGKSTLLRIITRLIKPTHGSVEINTNKVAMVFQNFALFPRLSVHDNIGFGLKMAKFTILN